MYKNSAIYFHICNYCSATIHTLKTPWSGTLIQAENVAIYSNIVGSFTFGKLSKKSWVHFCTPVNVIRCCSGVITDVPMHFLVFPIEMTCYREIRRSVVRSSVQTCQLVCARATQQRLRKTCMTDPLFSWVSTLTYMYMCTYMFMFHVHCSTPCDYWPANVKSWLSIGIKLFVCVLLYLYILCCIYSFIKHSVRGQNQSTVPDNAFTSQKSKSWLIFTCKCTY